VTAEVTAEAWAGRSEHVPDVDAAIALLRAELRPQDVVLVKASRAAGLERVALALTAAGPGPAGVDASVDTDAGATAGTGVAR
jgi:hypothetical protein